MSVLTTTCTDETATLRFAETLALAMRPGDLVFLKGDLGAGKTTLARALIRSASGNSHLEVPSPTFTLMQTYENLPFGKLAHIDLYRIDQADDLDELGIEEALEEGVALVEWPEKGRDALPNANLLIELVAQEDDARCLTISGSPDIISRLQRSTLIREFLNEHEHQSSARKHLTGDASSRAYETITPETGPPAILMNAPEQPDGPPLEGGQAYSKIAKLAENMTAFVAVARALEMNGFRPPQILADDLDAGLLLIEDLGSEGIINEQRQPIADRYLAAIELLAELHTKDWNPSIRLDANHQHHVPSFDREAILIEVDLLSQWYAPNKLGKPLGREAQTRFNEIWNDLIDQLESCETSLVLRDYHSPNIIWIDDAVGTDRIGLIDFQDALIGPTAYDVASLAQDARVDVREELEVKLLDHYCRCRLNGPGDFDETGFRSAYAIMAAQRATKILGIFVRLSKRDGKHVYLNHLDRIETYLKRSLHHPALADYRNWMADEFQL